jgi:polygalacturonase
MASPPKLSRTLARVALALGAVLAAPACLGLSDKVFDLGGGGGDAGALVADAGGARFKPDGGVVDVTTFGARNDGTGDARGPVAQAIAAGGCGSTIYFPAGTYRFDGEIEWHGCRTYLGEDGAALTGHGDYGTLVSIHDAHDMTIQNLTWKGGGLRIEHRDSTDASGLLVDNNAFELATSCKDASDPECNTSAIRVLSKLAHSRISNNLFKDFALGSDGWAVVGGCYEDVVVASNEVVGVPAGFRFDSGDCGGPATFELNYFDAIGRSEGAPFVGPGLYLLGGPQDVTVQDNWFENPSLSTTFHDNDSSYAFRVSLYGSRGTLIRRNIVLAPDKPDGTGCRIGFAVGGVSTTITDNWIDGIHVGIGDDDAFGAAGGIHAVESSHNHIRGADIAIQAPDAAFDTFESKDDGPDASTPVSPATRERPRRNQRYDAGP